MTDFKGKLEEFANKHKTEIKKNPVFRMRFHQMCSKIGVDPLASKKGFWGEILGVGSFYFELGVQILDVCLRTRPQNGGLISITELHENLIRQRGGLAQPINLDDIERSIKKLAVLGNGLSVIALKDGSRIVRSVPCDLTNDHTVLLNKASV
eukprot:c19139_g1_i5.p1 GENE.c19139_g1_i5~~c19139_g1_i5.p1  ORF type:complete len:152 (+),score=43.33 c19139_g1_i5:193-648(+)